MKRFLSVLLILTLLCSFMTLPSMAKEEPYGTVVEATYASSSPDMSNELPDASWGEKVTTVTKDSPNADILTYHLSSTTKNLVRADLYLDVYLRWDDTNLYLCFVSPDEYIQGAETHHKGDGIWLDIVYGIVNMNHYSALLADDSSTFRENYAFSATFASDNKSVDYDGATCSLPKEPVVYYHENEQLLVVKYEIPFTKLGLSKKDTPKDGDILSFSLIRIEGIQSDEYLGWLEWGNFWDAALETEDQKPNHINDPKCQSQKTTTGNSIRLTGKSTPAETTAQETLAPTEEPKVEEPVTNTAELPSEWAREEVKNAILAGLVPEALQGSYHAGISRGNLAKMLSLLLDKVYGKAPKKNDAVFTDTADADVLKAANLGIINGFEENGAFSFKPENTLTRAQISKIISCVADLCGVTTTGYESEVKFTDTVGSWCNSYLGYPVHVGIVKGTTATTFTPNGTLTVEQTIMIMYRTYLALK